MIAHSIPDSAKLIHVGEKALLERIVIPALIFSDGKSHVNGDDCAVLPTGPDASNVVFTIDCAPRPLFMSKVSEVDYLPFGWMSVLITYTDLISMGAKPIGLLLSLEMPANMNVGELRRLLEGVRGASHQFDIPIVGGNIKDSPALNLVSSGIGMAKRPLLRSTAVPGDSVYVLGYSGYFISSFLAKFEHHIQVGDRTFQDFYYVPEICDSIFRRLSAQYEIHASMDSSDGVTACLYDIAKSSGVRISVRAADIPIYPEVNHIATLQTINPAVLALTWGSWEFVFTSSDHSLENAVLLMKDSGVPIAKVGIVSPGNGDVVVIDAAGERPLIDVSSKRFDSTSSFSGGFSSYVAGLKASRL